MDDDALEDYAVECRIRKELFLEEYKKLCIEHGMYIGVYCGEGSFGEVGVAIEESASENELSEHFEELENS
jgi:hypothetical protein